jgi:dethiobiotin synthetase
MKGFFVTGTDTEVGKTLIAAALIHRLQDQGINTCGYKPVVAGMYFNEGRLFNEDLETLLLVSNRFRSSNHLLTYNDVCPYRLTTPAAPHIVARQEGINLNSAVMLERFQTLQKNHQCIIVEGAGGFLVPINNSLTLGDFARLIGLPVILVVDIRLGCINHGLLTAAAITAHQLEFKGWVANAKSPPNEYFQENVDTLESIFQEKYQANLLGTIPYQEELQPPYSIENIRTTSKFLDITSL